MMSWWILVAIVCSIAVTQVLGMLWYGPLFGKQWMTAMGWDSMSKEEIKAKQKEAVPGYIASAAMAAVATGMLWIMLNSWDIAGRAMDDLHPAGAGALFGLMVWAAGYLPPSFVQHFFEDPHWKVWAIGLGYWGILAILWGTFVGAFGTL